MNPITLNLDHWMPHEPFAPIGFVSVEITDESDYSPIALVYYTLNGERQEYPLRLDLDKEVFIDHLEDEALENFIQDAAPRICQVVSAYEDKQLQPQGIQQVDAGTPF